jgi:glycosyltransferase involved in cell wall biosynthesis
MIKLAIILADNVESSIRVITEDISNNLPKLYSVVIFSIKYNCITPTEHIRPLFRHLWKLKDCDIIHLQAAMPISLTPLIRLLFPKVKIISTEHDFGWKYFKNTLPIYKSLILRLSLYVGRKLCHKNIYPSYALLRYIKAEFDLSDSSAVVYNGISDCSQDPKIIQTTPSEKFTMRVVVVGNYYFSKGIDLIMSIANEMSGIEFHLFGDVFNGLSEQEYIDIQKKLDNKRVIIYGKVGRKEFIDFLNQNKSVVCIPSRSEVCPLVAIEAMATSHPLVVSNIPVFNEITSEDVSVIFDINDTDSLQKSLSRAFAEYNTLSKNGRELFLRNYTVDKMTEQYEIQYRELI